MLLLRIVAWMFCMIVSIPDLCVSQETTTPTPAVQAPQGPPTEFEKQKKALQEELAHQKEMSAGGEGGGGGGGGGGETEEKN